MEEEFQYHDFTDIKLKKDPENYPFLLTPGKQHFIYVDNKHPKYEEAYPFLIQIAQYISRPVLMHVYQISKFSIYAALVLGGEKNKFLGETLLSYSKNAELPVELQKFIEQNQRRYGSAIISLIKTNIQTPEQKQMEEEQKQMFANKKLTGIEFDNQQMETKGPQYVLKIDKKEYERLLKMKNGNDFELAQQCKVLDTLQEVEANENDPNFLAIRQQMEHKEEDNDLQDLADDVNDDEDEDEDENNEMEVEESKDSTKNQNGIKKINNKEKEEQKVNIESQKKEDKEQTRQYKYFQVHQERNLQLCGLLVQQDIPYIQEYDYQYEEKQEKEKLAISKYPSTKIRPYQEKALASVFHKGKARSGLIILPCGGGKTCTGIMIAKNIARSTIVLCERDTQVHQWKDQFLKFCNVNPKRIFISLKDKSIESFSPDNPLFQHKKPQDYGAFILILTYKTLSERLKKKDEDQFIKFIHNNEWGLLLADECQTLPAQTYQNVLKLKYKVKIGLTATPYREDKNINLLYQGIGPTLFEANLLDLINQGYLANPYCIDIRCEMTEKFLSAYNTPGATANTKQNLYQGNINKLKVLDQLINMHEQRGDTILVFINNIFVIDFFGKKLKKPFIHGKCSTSEKLFFIDLFKRKKIKTLLLSSVGDTGIDLPEASVGIQVSGFFQSRRQEVQRFGRIMRAKKDQCGEINAYYYNLVSLKTEESEKCAYRQKCLVDQGLSFEIVQQEQIQGFNTLNQFDELESEYLQSVQTIAAKKARNKEL